jgi:hypothetical protein
MQGGSNGRMVGAPAVLLGSQRGRDFGTPRPGAILSLDVA